MIKLKKLYSEPQTFDPIIFKDGINLILGDKSTESNKTNAVGKSICIEFINFCLLKDKGHSRVMLIDDVTLSPDTIICLDLQLFNDNVTIQRTKESPDTPRFIINSEKTIDFDNSGDALKYLNTTILNLALNKEIPPSFRELMGPLIRDEKSEFKNILKCYDTSIRSPENLIPHLFFFNLNLNLYREIKDLIIEIKKLNQYLSKINKQIEELHPNKKIDKIKLELNSSQAEINKINNSIQELNITTENFKEIKLEITNLEDQIDLIRKKQSAIKHQIIKIERAPEFEEIKEDEIEVLYNQFRQGLGTQLKKSIDEVKSFKYIIDDFQKKILSEKLNALKNEQRDNDSSLSALEVNLKEKVSTIAHDGFLRNLRNSLSVYDKKNAEISKTRSLFSELNTEKQKKNEILIEKSSKILEFDFELTTKNEQIIDFEKTILEIHDFLMGNKKATFSIEVNDKKNQQEFIEIIYRTDHDGSHSTDRTKVFIYDIALLINQYTSKKHPNLLIHDNIFDVDQDTMVKSLNYLNTINDKYKFQYILTLNSDKIENESTKKLIKLDIKKYTIARFTKNNRFLKKGYQEMQKLQNKKTEK